MFCQRLGLETGWNCHISLGDCCGTTTIVDDRSSSLVSEGCPLLPNKDGCEIAGCESSTCSMSKMTILLKLMTGLLK